MFYSEGKPCSALLIAAYRGHKDIVELLVAAGASVDVVDGSGETPLHKASSEGHRDVVELLITNGAQIDAETKDGCTSLYLAAWNQHREIAQFLLDCGAVMQPEIAVMLGDIELVKHYLDSGLDVNSFLVKGLNKEESWLIAAIMGRNKNLIELLLNCGANVNEKMKSKNVSPLHRASATGCLDICELLIDHGADVNALGEHGKTPLHLATQLGHQNITELLLDCGANVNALDESKSSPLFEAARHHDLSVAESLLDHGAEVNLIDNESWTPLLRAFQHSGNDEIVRVLVAYGADVNVRGLRGESPLHLAVAQRNKDMVELLLAHGAREGLE
ncbi:MAG: ankyrin repeat domain-containing protein [Nostoc sp.]|uniref:ankyrin repeat domain-containing protein n=1 Tax=unclassified Nostoc TaxID=2593658 RepID=UPI0025CCEF1E|nr:ankyrin repeat domain-containing protein [Nostoc sp. NOS(2021)]MBN3896996.1 ankyrin repeat domain-containing protein [Nostoc sp. NOS(2021)]